MQKQIIKMLLGSQYFLYFGVLGIFLPYFNLYCYHIGFSGFQIGTLSGLRSLVVVLAALLWSTAADRFQVRKPVYIFCNFAGSLAWILYLFTENFHLMLLVTLLYSLFYGPIISFLEAFTMDALEQEKNSYGRIRAWGSVSFILIVAVVGKVIDLFGIRIILWLILSGSLVQAVISAKIPDNRPVARSGSCCSVAAFLNARVLVFLFSGFLMLVSHGTYYGFFSIHLEKLGFGSTFIGVSWALASVAEILVMMNSERLFRAFPLEQVILWSFAAAAVRWMMLAVATSAGVILVSQLFHAVTFAAFHVASILYIDRLTPEESKTFGQSVNNAVTYGLGMMVGLFGNGVGFERLSSLTLFLLSSAVALAGGLLFGVFHMTRSRLDQQVAAKDGMER